MLPQLFGFCWLATGQIPGRKSAKASLHFCLPFMVQKSPLWSWPLLIREREICFLGFRQRISDSYEKRDRNHAKKQTGGLYQYISYVVHISCQTINLFCFASVHWSHWRPLMLNTSNILFALVWNLDQKSQGTEDDQLCQGLKTTVWAWLSQHNLVWASLCLLHRHRLLLMKLVRVFDLQDRKPNLNSIEGHKGDSDSILENMAPAMLLIRYMNSVIFSLYICKFDCIIN